MRVDVVIRDVKRSLEQVVRALAHGLTAEENLSGQGGSKNQVLTNTGPNTAPVWSAPEKVVVEAVSGPPFRPLDADDLESGKVPSDRMVGNYPKIIGVGTLTQLKVANGIFQHSQTISISQSIPVGWGSPLVGPIDIAYGAMLDIGGVVEILG